MRKFSSSASMELVMSLPTWAEGVRAIEECARTGARPEWVLAMVREGYTLGAAFAIAREAVREDWEYLPFLLPATLNAHKSVEIPGQVAYTCPAQNDLGYKVMRVRAGKFLRREFPDATDAEIQDMVRNLGTDCLLDWELITDPTPDQMVRIYTHYVTDGGGYPSVNGSCMRYRVGEGDFKSLGDDEHPVQVYCAGDIGILVGRYPGNTRTAARCLVNIAKKKLARFYGSGDADQIKALEADLEKWAAENGYTRDSENALVGCRLLKVDHGGDNWLMPYLDGSLGVEDRGRYWEISRYGEGGQRTDGVLWEIGYQCYICGDRVPEDDSCRGSDDYYYCDRCWARLFFICCHCDEAADVDERVDTHDGWMCEACWDRHGHRCDHCDTARMDSDGSACVGSESWCARCIDRYATWCEECREYHGDEDECPNAESEEAAGDE